MKWTQQQQDAIEIRGNNVLVSAAAGSGKTAVLTERIRRLITEDRVSIENMLVVTFSNAAAAEMKEKIIKSLNSALTELGTQEQSERAFLKKQIKKARNSDISTFHKFSMGVIRRYFYVTDTEPDFGICDDSRRQILISEALDELIDDRFENDGEAFSEFLTSYCDMRSEDGLRSMILQIYTFIMSMPYPFRWLSESIERLSMDTDAFKKSAEYRFIIDTYRKDLQKAYDMSRVVCDSLSELPVLYEKAEKDSSAVAAALEILQDTEDMNALASALNFKYETFRARREEKESYEEIKEIISVQRDRMKKLTGTVKEQLNSISLEESVKRMQDTRKPAEYLYSLVLDFHNRFAERKKERKLLDFNDIEHTALEILRHDEIAAEYRKHFDAVFIDEYQDSSVLQETLINRISRGNNVYMVGDVKQSIYKFRLAEPELFISKYNSFRDGSELGERIDLNRNFRSKGNVINAINTIFTNIMNTETCGIEYDEAAALKKGTDYEGILDRTASLHLIDDTVPEDISSVDEEIAELKKTELEAKIVAELAAERIGMEIYDQKKDCTRPVGCGDIVVLLRGTRGVSEIYARALKDAGLPAYIDAGEGFFETTEIEVFINLLRIIDNRRRDIPLLSVLRSPIFGFTIDELIEIRLSCRDGSYSEAFLKYSESESATATLTEKCRQACEKLDRWREAARYMSLENFLWELMRETGYFDYVSALPGGDRRTANLSSLIDKAVDFSSSQMKGLFGFITYVEAVGRNNVPIGQAMQTGNTDNMVRIMTIHKSKGLEFPVVILAGLGKQFNRDRNTGKVIMHRELGFALQYSDIQRKCFSKTLRHRVISQQKERERMAEEMRILYVAMTRAMDELVMVGTLKKLEDELEKYHLGIRGGVDSARCYLDWIVPFVEKSDIKIVLHNRMMLSEEAAEELHSADMLEEEMKKGFPDFKDTNGLMKVIQSRFEFDYPYSADVFSKSKFAVTELNRALKHGWQDSGVPVQNENASQDSALAAQTADIPQFLRGEEQIGAAMRGTLTHKVLELIPFERELSEDDVRKFTLSLVSKNIMTEKEAAAVDCSRIAAFFLTETGKRACKAQWLRKEWAFTLRKHRNEIAAMAASRDAAESLRKSLPEELLIQGIIDCCFRDEGGIVLVDYKTDRINQGRLESEYRRLREEYGNQIALYREVVEKSLGESVSEAVLFLVNSGTVLPM